MGEKRYFFASPTFCIDPVIPSAKSLPHDSNMM
jgi:hypothetical protein